MNLATRTLVRLLGLLATIALVTTGCGSSNDADTTDAAEEAYWGEDSADDAEVVTEAGLDEAMEEEGERATADVAQPASADGATAGDDDAAPPADGEAGDDLGAGAVASTQRTAADLGRKIIFNAFITVEVDDVAAAGRKATEIIAGFDGFVYGQDTEAGVAPRSTLVFKVLPEDFDDAVEALGTVGELRAQAITADDVTERIVNLATRIEVAELGVERLRATLTNTTDLADYAELERLLLERESELEVMRANIRSLQDQVNLATITLTLVQDRVNHEITVAATVYETQDGGASCPGDSGYSIEQGTEVTVCFEIVNVGEEPVVDLTMIDPALGIDSADDLILVYGDLDRLEAGQSVALAYEMTVERDQNIRTKVTARPANAEGEIGGPSVDGRVDERIFTYESADDPGFGDGFDSGVRVLTVVWSVARVLVGFILPLLILLPFLAAAWFGLSRLRRWRANRGPRVVRKKRRPTVMRGQADATPPPPAGQPPATPSGPSGPADTPPRAPDALDDPDPTNVFDEG